MKTRTFFELVLAGLVTLFVLSCGGRKESGTNYEAIELSQYGVSFEPLFVHVYSPQQKTAGIDNVFISNSEAKYYNINGDVYRLTEKQFINFITNNQ